MSVLFLPLPDAFGVPSKRSDSDGVDCVASRRTLDMCGAEKRQDCRSKVVWERGPGVDQPRQIWILFGTAVIISHQAFAGEVRGFWCNHWCNQTGFASGSTCPASTLQLEGPRLRIRRLGVRLPPGALPDCLDLAGLRLLP